MTSKFVRSEPRKIRVKCEDGCPFLLYVSKDGCNPRLAVKTLVPKHNWYRILSNSRASAKFLAKLHKQKILEKRDYKVKDLKQDVEKELRVHVAYYKCKRARRMVLDAYKGTFTTKYSELEAYVDDLKRSNPRSIVQVELSRDEMREGRRVFSRMFVCLDVVKRVVKEDVGL